MGRRYHEEDKECKQRYILVSVIAKEEFRNQRRGRTKNFKLLEIKSSLDHWLSVVLTGISGSNIQDLEGRLDVLGNDVLDSAVALVPVEGLLVFLITVLPVL